MLKDITAILWSGEGSSRALDAGVALASAGGAHLTVVLAVPELEIPAVVGVSLSSEIIARQHAEAFALAKEQAAGLEERARRAGITFEIRIDQALSGVLPRHVARHARHADLVVVSQAAEDQPELAGRLIEATFMDSGRPALVIPYIGTRKLPPERVICAWDGSREASRALHDALPLLRGAEQVMVTTVDPDGLGGVGAQPGADIAAHLARHGVKVVVERLDTDGMSVGDVLLSQVGAWEADMLVMGAYGHSRFREMILSGATIHLLRHMTVPVLFAH